MLTWPAIQQLLNKKILEQDGSAFLVEVYRYMPNLPVDDVLPEVLFVDIQPEITRNTAGSTVTFPSLSRQEMYRLSRSYFDTFNFIYPFMDRQSFLSNTLTKVQSDGFDSGSDSIS